MEAGADFTDGLHLRDGGWELTVRPDAETLPPCRSRQTRRTPPPRPRGCSN